MHRPGRSNISARLTSFAPSSSHRMWEPINPSERDSFAREIADLPRSFNRDRDSFIISFDALGIFYPEREEGRFEDSLVCVERLFFNLSRTFKNEDEEDSPFRVIVPEFLYSSIIYLLFSSLEISTKILEKRTRKRRGERIDPPTPPSLFHTARLHKAWIRKWNFFSSSRKRNLFIEGIHSSESWAREQRFSIGVEERKRWIGDEKRVSNARALPPRGGESQTTSPPLQRFLLLYPFFFPQGEKSRRLFNLFCPRRGSSQRRGFQLLRKRALRRLLRAPFAELPRVPRPSREPSAACAHTMFLFLLCTHKCPTENVNLPSERFSACAIRARLAIDARLDKKKRERQREGLPLFFEARFSSSHSVNWNEF